MSSTDSPDILSDGISQENCKVDTNDKSSDRDSGYVSTENVAEKLISQSSQEEETPDSSKLEDDLESIKSSDQESIHSNVQKNSDQPFNIQDGSSRIMDDDGWLDIIGSGDFKKRVIKSGNGIESRPKQSFCVTLSYTCFKDNDVFVEQVKDFEFFVGELDIVQGLDLAVPLMEEGEIAEILVPPRLAYGKLGRKPDIPPDCPLRYEVEITKVEEVLDEHLLPLQAVKLGNKKRDRGNFWYGRGEYLNSVTCYKRATVILDSIQWVNSDTSECTPALQQSIVEERIKVYNNMAAAQLKLEAYDQALKSLDFVLRHQPKNVKALFRKGRILAAKGLTDEAITCMKKAAELEPDTKVIQQELSRLTSKKKIEDKSQRAMYKRMFPQSASKPRSSKFKKWLKHGSFITGGCVALAIGIAAFRQYYL